jgi:hypothetical protein
MPRGGKPPGEVVLAALLGFLLTAGSLVLYWGVDSTRTSAAVTSAEREVEPRSTMNETV